MTRMKLQLTRDRVRLQNEVCYSGIWSAHLRDS